MLLLVTAAVAAGSWFFYFRDADEVPEDEPLLATVEIGDIENTIAAAGSLQPFEFVDVGAQVSGLLEKLHVEVGDVVEAGQLLAEIDARVQAARVEASRASIEALEAQVDARRASLQLAEANADRQTRLMAADATSQLEYDNAITSLATAQASLIQLEKQIEQSRASLESDQTQLEFSSIFAPTAGTVVSIEMNEGRTLNAAQIAPTILRIANLNTMTVQAEISEADIGSIYKGMEVYFTTLGGGNRRWYSTLRQILPTPVVENNVVLYTGLFDIENADSSLLPEMTAQVYFVTAAARDVLTVPLGALTFLARQAGAGRGRPGGDGTSSAEAPGAARAAATGRSPTGGPPPGFNSQSRGAPGAGGFSRGAGARAAANLPPGGRALPRPARVMVYREDGTQEEREILVGVTSRIAAEVVEGLEAGEQVVAGIIQNNIPETPSFNGPPGGFRRPF